MTDAPQPTFDEHGEAVLPVVPVDRTALLTAAVHWHMQGASVLPVRLDGSKAPGGGLWKNYQHERAPMSQVSQWFDFVKPTTDGVGVLTGGISNHLEMIELEGRAVEAGILEQLSTRIQEHADTMPDGEEGVALYEAWNAVMSGYAEESGGLGLHFFFRTEGPSKSSTRLAAKLDHDDLTESGKPKIKVLIETRGEGGFVVCAPSAGRSRAKGGQWRCVSGSIKNIPTITVEQRDAIYAICTGFNETPAKLDRPKQAEMPDGYVKGDRPGDQFNAEADWDSDILLTGAGWRKAYKVNDGYGWRRPGKDTPGLSATTGQAGTGDQDRLFVFTSSTDFPTEEPLTKFWVYAELHHKGDLKAATLALAKMGYGKPNAQGSTQGAGQFADILGPMSPEEHLPDQPAQSFCAWCDAPANGTADWPGEQAQPSCGPEHGYNYTPSATLPSLAREAEVPVQDSGVVDAPVSAASPDMASIEPGTSDVSDAPSDGSGDSPLAAKEAEPSDDPFEGIWETKDKPLQIVDTTIHVPPLGATGREVTDLVVPDSFGPSVHEETPDTDLRVRTLVGTQDAHATRLINEFGGLMRWNADANRWIVWDGWLWREQAPDAGQAYEYSKLAARNMPENNNDEIKAKKACLSSNGVAAALRMAQTVPIMRVGVNDLDSWAWELSTPGGIVDLKSGELLPPKPSHLHTKATSCVPDWSADRTAWLRFLDTTFQEDAELIEWMQRLLGYVCIGEVREHILPVFFGQGQNGKSVLMDAMVIILGDYATTMPNKFFNAGGEQLSDKAKLIGKRLAIVSETNEGETLNEALVKETTGGDQLTGRALYANYVEWKPSHTFLMGTNHRFEIPSGGTSMWRRLREIPFDHEMADADKIDDFGGILGREHGPAILSWLVDGAKAYKDAGLRNEPAAVMRSTSDYRTSTDTLAAFVDDLLVLSPHFSAPAAEVRRRYEQFCAESGDRAISHKAMTIALSKRWGITNGRTASSRWYHGARLADATDTQEESPKRPDPVQAFLDLDGAG